MAVMVAEGERRDAANMAVTVAEGERDAANTALTMLLKARGMLLKAIGMPQTRQ